MTQDTHTVIEGSVLRPRRKVLKRIDKMIPE